jgi:hypothetical protein
MRMRQSWIGMGLVLTAISATAQVTGSGTSGTVPKFTGTSTIGNSPISINGSNVGIGTTSPGTALDVEGGSIKIGGISTQTPTMSIGSYGQDGHWLNLYPTLHFHDFNNITESGDQGIIFSGGSQGTGALTIAPWASATSGLRMLGNGNVGIGITSPAYRLDVVGQIHTSSGIVLPDGSVQSTAWTGVLCGGDYAESVDVSGDRTHYASGDILVINPDAPGKFLKSVEPYSTAVLGVYSTKPGVLGRHQTGPTSPDEVPMAMVGIVPAKVSAENGAIRPGDLLVTASTPGYAMKGTDRGRMLGAVVGKAMGSLDSGTGVIEVGVTLQ